MAVDTRAQLTTGRQVATGTEELSVTPAKVATKKAEFVDTRQPATTLGATKAGTAAVAPEARKQVE